MLLAEIEQVAHTDRQDKKNPNVKPKISEMKPKRQDEPEGEKGGGKGKPKAGGDGKGLP